MTGKGAFGIIMSLSNLTHANFFDQRCQGQEKALLKCGIANAECGMKKNWYRFQIMTSTRGGGMKNNEPLKVDKPDHGRIERGAT
jgi:hypothetical protein